MTFLESAAPALVAAHNSNGALAAIRDLGSAGIAVLSPRPPLTSPVRFSRFITTTIRPFPDGRSGRRQLAWLLRAGRDHPGTVLIPAMDDLTAVIAHNQDVLKPYFHLYYPPGAALNAVLNKESLHLAAQAAGIATPAAWFPGSGAEAATLAPELPYPVVLKPRTHVGKNSWFKGRLVTGPSDFVADCRRAAALLESGVVAGEARPGDLLPFVQAYTPGAASRIYNLSGFLDHTGLLTGFSASRKVFQTPRRFGVGVCFEAAPVNVELAAQLTTMLRSMGFFGMFEAEFIEAAGSLLLIDVNPRVFNGLSFTTQRGLRLPLIWYLAAIGDWAGVEEQLATARRSQAAGGGPDAWCHRFVLETMVASRVLTGRMGLSEARKWWGWVRRDKRRTLEASWEQSDPWPGRLNGLQHVIRFARDPRDFIGSIVRD
ncbi:MAG: hypothetical protein ACRDG3_02325 [Tepidiformaceae bacterium]